MILRCWLGSARSSNQSLGDMTRSEKKEPSDGGSEYASIEVSGPNHLLYLQWL